jgi:hypothetical protein
MREVQEEERNNHGDPEGLHDDKTKLPAQNVSKHEGSDDSCV